MSVTATLVLVFLMISVIRLEMLFLFPVLNALMVFVTLGVILTVILRRGLMLLLRLLLLFVFTAITLLVILIIIVTVMVVFLFAATLGRDRINMAYAIFGFYLKHDE